MTMSLAILEDNHERQQAMQAAVVDAIPEATCIFFNSAHTMIDWLRDHIDTPGGQPPALISLDHDLDFLPGPDGQRIDPGDGRDVARFLATQKPCCPVIVHTSNALGASSMMCNLQDAGWQVERVLPEANLLWVGERWKPTILRHLNKVLVHNTCDMPNRWVTSLGGPLLLLPESALRSWTGYQPTQHPAVEGISFRRTADPNGPLTDYDRACSIEGYVGLIDVGDAKGLVLGDEPNSTAWVPTKDGGLLVRWVYAENAERASRSLHDLTDGDFDSPEFLLPVPSSPLLLLDSASPGDEKAREEALVIKLMPATYEISTADYRPDEYTSLIIHRLRAK